MSDETVKLEITLSWSYAGNADLAEEVDTGYSVDEWNAMTEAFRENVKSDAFLGMVAEYYTGSTTVLTPGAKD